MVIFVVLPPRGPLDEASTNIDPIITPVHLTTPPKNSTPYIYKDIHNNHNTIINIIILFLLYILILSFVIVACPCYLLVFLCLSLIVMLYCFRRSCWSSPRRPTATPDSFRLFERSIQSQGRLDMRGRKRGKGKPEGEVRHLSVLSQIQARGQTEAMRMMRSD